MITKVVLSPEDCATLAPNWYELNQDKLQRLLRISTKKSTFDRKTQVIATPPIIILPNHGREVHGAYIINGKHRAVTCNARGYSLDACIISNADDILHHTPSAAYGGSVQKLLDAFEERFDVKKYCQDEGVYTIADLVRKNVSLLRIT